MSASWTAEDNIRLYELWKHGLDDVQIGKIMYYSQASIWHRRNRMGLKPNGAGNRQWTDDDDEMLTEMWNRGVPIKDIMMDMGYSETTIRVHRKQLKLKGRRNMHNDLQ